MRTLILGLDFYALDVLDAVSAGPLFERLVLDEVSLEEELSELFSPEEGCPFRA